LPAAKFGHLFGNTLATALRGGGGGVERILRQGNAFGHQSIILSPFVLWLAESNRERSASVVRL
jgi:hypothetical protein